MFEAKTQKDILKDLIDEYRKRGGLSDVEGTFVGDTLSANAVEFEKAYLELALMIESAFATTAWGEYLTMRAAESGVIRKPAVPAIGEVTVTGTGIVRHGSMFSTKYGEMFRATATVEIDGNGKVPIQAVKPGESGNVLEKEIKVIPVSIDGISGVTNEEPTYDGYNEESDDELRERYLEHVRHAGTSGNVQHYLEWARSVPGVGAAQVVPLWKGPGTVKVYVVDARNDKASEKLLKEAQTYIDSVRPIGATVTVTTPEYKEITVSAKVKVINNKTYKQVLTEAINKCLVESGFSSNYISIARIGTIMLQTGVISDYEQLKIDGDIVNVQLPQGYIPRLKRLEVSEIG